MIMEYFYPNRVTVGFKSFFGLYSFFSVSRSLWVVVCESAIVVDKNCRTGVSFDSNEASGTKTAKNPGVRDSIWSTETYSPGFEAVCK